MRVKYDHEFYIGQYLGIFGEDKTENLGNYFVVQR